VGKDDKDVSNESLNGEIISYHAKINLLNEIISQLERRKNYLIQICDSLIKKSINQNNHHKPSHPNS